jgi:[ribosomal protein S5]-alanine N-acetyltransferase
MYDATHDTLLSPTSNDDFVVCLKSTSDPDSTPEIIGKMGIWRIPEIGFIFKPTSWGKGIATEALKCFLKYFWDTHGDVKAIVADLDPRNEMALNLLLKNGFVKTGFEEKTFELEDGWCDSVYLKLFHEESEVEGPRIPFDNMRGN